MDRRDKIIHKHQIELTELIIEGKEKEVWNYSRLLSRLDWNDENDPALSGCRDRMRQLEREIMEERKRLLYLSDQLSEGKFATRASYQA